MNEGADRKKMSRIRFCQKLSPATQTDEVSSVKTEADANLTSRAQHECVDRMH